MAGHNKNIHLDTPLTLSHGTGMKFCKNISNHIRVMKQTRNYEVLTADGQTNTQNFGRYNIIPRHFLWRGVTKIFSRHSSFLDLCIVMLQIFLDPAMRKEFGV